MTCAQYGESASPVRQHQPAPSESPGAAGRGGAGAHRSERVTRCTSRTWQRTIPRMGLQLLASLLLLAGLLLPTPAAQAQHYNFSRFNQADGLLNQDVSAMVQDGRGVLWVGTENGLFQADGIHFIRVPSFSNALYGSVLAMHVDDRGRVWVLGARQLVYYTADGLVHAIPGIQPNLLLEDGAALASLPSRPDTLYVLLGGHLQQVRTTDDGRSWQVGEVLFATAVQQRPLLQQFSSLLVDGARQEIWAGCGNALCELHPAALEAVDQHMAATTWDSVRGVPANHWQHLALAHDGAIWARGTGDTLRLRPESWAVERFGQPADAAEPPARYSLLLEDPDGSMLATIQDGLARWKDGKWTRYTSQNGLPPSQIATMFFDRSGGFWLAPIGQGIWRWLGYGNWEAWTRSEGLSSDVAGTMLRDKHATLWVADTDDLDRIDQATGRAAPRRAGKPLRETETIASDTRGHMWTGGSSGSLLDLDLETQAVRHVADDLGYVYMVRQEKAVAGQPDPERVWVCSQQGVGYVSSADQWSKLHQLHDAGAPPADAWGVTEDPSGTLWFSAQGGLYRLGGGSWSHVLFPDGSKLIDYPVLQAAGDGTLWLQGALPEPLLHISVSGARARIIDTVGANVIGSDDLSFIKIDHRGWIWVGSDLGVYVFNGKRWVHCTEEDGLISDDTDTSGVFEDSDGSMWFSTANGISHLLHPEELFRVAAPEINLRNIRLNGQELHSGQNGDFRFRSPELTIQLFSTYYKRPRALAFRYRLLGLENDWQTADAGTLYFSSLPAGDFTLSVQAIDKRVEEVSAPIDYSFTVLPPWYRRDRFRGMAALLLLAFGAFWWRVSLHRLKTSEAVLQQKVDEQTAQLLAEKQQLEHAQRELLETASKDALTGLLNRSAIFNVLAAMRRQALERGTMLSVVMADLDHFKSINDRYGHMVGDAVLRECAERFRETLRPVDAVGRYGGEELLLVIPGLTPAHAEARMDEIRVAICTRPVVHGEHTIHVTCSFGVAWLNEQHRDVEAVVEAADEALYRAKQNGRNRVEFTRDLALKGVSAGSAGGVAERK